MNIRSAVTFAGVGLAAVLAARPAPTQSVESNTIPAALGAPAGQVLTVTAHADGVQIYACGAAKDDPAHFSWTLKAPEAELRDEFGKALGKHYAGPTWEAQDGSKVVGELIAKSDAPDGTAIPWLLLRAKANVGSGVFGAIRTVQRLHTVGGLAPAGGCDAARTGQETRVPYSADYRFYGTDSSSPVGEWKTFDDKTGEARAIVRIYERDGRLFGKIERSFKPGSETRVCVECTDDRKNQPIVGLVVIRNIKREGDEYAGGDILDPESGSVYRCKMHVEQSGTRLVLRGYFGISLLGRTQTWQRQS